MKLFNYLFPTDWEDVKKIETDSFSHINGSKEGLSRMTIIQRSPSTGKYRKQTININII